MTNLTEQKGKKTHYYIKLPNSDVFIGDEFALSLYRNCKDGDKVEVLGEVPSYGLWKSLNGNMDSVMQTNKALAKWCEEFNALDVAKENTKLKELLKECIIYVDKYVAFSVVQGNEEREVKSKELLAKINQVLGEE